MAWLILCSAVTPGIAQQSDLASSAACGLCGPVKIVGSKALSEQLACAVGRLGCVDPHDSAEREVACERLVTFYKRKGYLDATVVWRNDLGPIEITEGSCYTVASYEFEGNQITRDGVLASVSFMNLGGCFREDLLETTLSCIDDLGLFQPMKRSDVDVTPNAEAHTVSIVVHVHER